MSTEESNRIDSEQLIFWLILVGISVLFIASSIAFLYIRVTQDIPPIQLPSLFIVSTLAITLSGYFIYRLNNQLGIPPYLFSKVYFWLCLFALLIFFITQWVAAQQLIGQESQISENNSLGFLYFLFGLHFVHVIAGIPFLFYLSRKYKIAMKMKTAGIDYAERLSTTQKRMKFLVSYWHFIEILWIYLILLFFLIDFL